MAQGKENLGFVERGPSRQDEGGEGVGSRGRYHATMPAPQPPRPQSADQLSPLRGPYPQCAWGGGRCGRGPQYFGGGPQ